MPREVVECSSLEIFRSCLHTNLDSVLWVTLPEQGGWAKRPLVVPSSLKHFVILWYSLNRAVLWRANFCNSSTHSSLGEEKYCCMTLPLAIVCVLLPLCPELCSAKELGITAWLLIIVFSSLFLFHQQLQSEVEKPLLNFRENFKKDMKKCDHHIADLRKQLASRYAAVEKVGAENKLGNLRYSWFGQKNRCPMKSFCPATKNHKGFDFAGPQTSFVA